ncbi:MAG: hypothetical protein ABIH74_05640 [Candidatus Omnitrophota bacterium]
MPRGKTQTKVDSELSKTYFATSTGGTEGIFPKKTAPHNDYTGQVKVLVVALSIVAGLILFAVYFFYRNQVHFTVNISMEQPAVVRSSARAVQKRPVRVPVGQNILYNFENDNEGWEIPSWEFEKDDHVAGYLRKISGISSKGRGSLELYAEFPGKKWTAALAEVQQFIDLGKYSTLSADIYLPPSAPEKLRGKIILTGGENWHFAEMTRGIRLKPGEWTTITADISENSTDWKKTKMTSAFREDIRKVAVRVESDKNPVYSGLIFIDNIRAS